MIGAPTLRELVQAWQAQQDKCAEAWAVALSGGLTAPTRDTSSGGPG